MPRRVRVASFALALPALGLAAATARAQTGETCVAAYEGAQELRQRGELVQARRELDVCRAACPAALARDCEVWARDVASRLGRVRIEVRRDGRAVTPRSVLVDGAPAVVGADGSIALDPGRHELRVAIEGTGTEVREVSLPPGGETSLRIDVATPGPTAARWPPPTIAIVLGAAGTGALLVGGGLAIAGHVQVADLRDTCAPDCAASEVDAVRATWIAGGVAAGVGVGALAVAIAITLGGGSADGGVALSAPPAGAPLGLGARARF